jgi:hypothetical protein
MSRSFVHRSVSGAAHSYSLVLPAGFVHVGGSWSPEVALSEVVGQLGLEDDQASDFRRQARPLFETPTTATETGLRLLDSYALAGTWPGTRISATVTCGVADVPPGADPDHTLMAQAARNGGCITAVAGELLDGRRRCRLPLGAPFAGHRPAPSDDPQPHPRPDVASLHRRRHGRR